MITFLQIKDKSKYRTRNGFAQNNGIAQFSASFNRRNDYKIRSFFKQNSLHENGDQYRPTSYEPYRPQQPRTFGAFSDDECYLNSASFNGATSSSHFPNLDLPYDVSRPIRTSPSNRYSNWFSSIIHWYVWKVKIIWQDIELIDFVK